MLKFGLRLAFWLLPFLFAAVTATKEVAESYFPNLSSADKTDYNSWLNLNFGTSYARHSFLASTADPDLGAAVFWNIDGDEINFAVAVRAEGWLSFGISEAGGMLGADVVQFETLKPSQLIDSYVLEDRAAPLTDDCQNWNLISTTINNGWIILEINRKLDTQDSQDHKIANDQALFIAPTRLIAAWGDQSVVSFHGLNRARNAVRLFAEDSVSVSEALKETLEQNSDSFFDVREDNHQISTAETDYHVVCKTFTQIQQEIGTSQSPLTVVGAIPVISEGSAEFIHHFTVYTQADCSTGISTRSMIYAWAPGNEGWTLPDDVGFSMFDGANRQAVSVEIHYNNPSGISGKTDSSGTRFYYSEEERPQKAAILELGDPSMALNGEAINNGLTQYEFTCPGACSSTFFGGTSVTVLAECKQKPRQTPSFVQVSSFSSFTDILSLF
jgi:dopamine beta-monooxygenase